MVVDDEDGDDIIIPDDALIIDPPLMLPVQTCANCNYQNDIGDVVCMGCGWPIANDSDTIIEELPLH